MVDLQKSMEELEKELDTLRQQPTDLSSEVDILQMVTY